MVDAVAGGATEADGVVLGLALVGFGREGSGGSLGLTVLVGRGFTVSVGRYVGLGVARAVGVACWKITGVGVATGLAGRTHR